MDVLIMGAAISHRADRITRRNFLACPYKLGIRVQYFVRKTIGIPYGDHPGGALTGACHYAAYWRMHRWVREVDSMLPTDIIKIDTAVRN